MPGAAPLPSERIFHYEKEFFTMKYFSCTFALIAFVAQIHSATAAEIVVQAGGTGTAQTGSWSSATDATMPYNGNLGVYTQAGNTATYTFAPTFPQTTTYAVEV